MKTRTLKATIILTALVLTGAYSYLASAGGPALVFFDVGQGDSTLIELPGGRLVLVDGGPDDLVLERLGEELPFFKRRLDLIVISHPHDDHITGLVSVVRRYQVGKIVYGAGEEDKGLMPILLAEARRRGVELAPLASGETVTAAACRLEIFNPESLKIPEDENNSLVSRLTCPELSALLSGDNPQAVEKALLASGRAWSAAVFKASHHGSKTANSEAFLRAVAPRLAVFSAGLDNRFGHPHPEITALVKRLGIGSWRTDQQGSLRLH